MDKTELKRQLKHKYATDFAAYAERFVKIRTKAGDFVPFKLNRVQRDLLAAMEAQLERTGRIRMIVLKARQQGFSTFMQAYTYWYMTHRRAKKAFVVANDLATTKTLFKMLTDTHKAMHEDFKPRTERASMRELLFGDLNSTIEVATAGSDALGRGNTLQLCWLSEVAYWPASSAADNMSGLLNCVPDAPGSIVVIESTANGVSGPYYDLYHGAPGNRFETFFAPWFHTAEYRDDNLPNGWGVPGSSYELTYDDLKMKENFGLDDAQIWWRRQKLAEVKDGVFARDFPSVPADAFQNSGAPMFDPASLGKQRTKADPILRQLVFDEMDRLFVPGHDGELRIYHEPELGETYTIGADTSFGIQSGDFSAAVVMDADKRVCAVYQGRTRPRAFANALNILGDMYEQAEICAEIDGPGYAMVQRLAHDLNYPHVWRRVSDQKVEVEDTENLGFRTNSQTKPMVIARLQEDLAHGNLSLNDVKLMEEMRIFIKFPDSVKLGAMPGPNNHDDLVMACALANYINDGRWLPVTVDDAFYREAL